jgi:hypothetical protein
VGRPTVCHHVSYSSGSCLPAEVGSGAATCSAALEPASLVKRALAPPCVPWVRTYWEGSSAPCVMCLRILPPCGEGSGPPRILRPPVGHGPQVQRKAQQAYLCGKARLFPMHVRTFSWCLTSEPSWACKTCGQASLPVLVRRADMRLQCSANAADHPPGTTTVYGDPTA